MKLRVDNRGILNTSHIVDAETEEILGDVWRSAMSNGYCLELKGTIKRYTSFDAAVAAGVKLLNGELIDRSDSNA